MNKLILSAIAAALAAGALPAAAQPSPSAPPGQPPMMGGGPRERGPMGPMFGNVSPEGRQILTEAMRDSREASDREALRAARERVLDLLDNDQLDVAALRQAQAQERALAQAQHERRQEAMLAAYQKLSAADRKALAAAMRDMERRMQERMGQMRDRMPRGQGGQNR